jgi:basic amino acid/polyamine antiporter, APA family
MLSVRQRNRPRVYSASVETQRADLEGTDEGLRRALSRWNALAIVVGAVIGTGIYLRPASVAQLVQTPAAILAVWVGAGLLSMAGALTYSDLAARLPRSGGEYAFLHATLGNMPAFMFGWMRLTLGVSIVGALAVAFTVFLSDFIALGAIARRVVPVLLIAVLAALNVLGVANAGRFQSFITAVKVASIVALVVALMVFAPSHASSVESSGSFSPATVGASAYGAALLAALASYNGWAHVTMVGGEVSDAQRSLPWALVIGLGVVIAIYLLANVAYLQALPMSDVLTSNSTAFPNAASIASRAIVASVGGGASRLLIVAFMISALGALHCNLLAVPRVFFAMARDGNMPEVLARVLPQRRTPYMAIIILAAFGALFAVFGSYDRLTNMASFAYLLFYAVNAFGLLYARKRLPAPAGLRRLPLWIPLSFLLATTAILVTVVVRGLGEITVALAVLGCGLLVYLGLRWRPRSRSSQTTAAIR